MVKVNAVGLMPIQNFMQPKKKVVAEPKVMVEPRALAKPDALSHMSNINKSLVSVKKQALQGWNPENKNNYKTISQMTRIIKNPSIQKIAVSGHKSPDGDSIGSTFAMANLINQATGKKVDLFIFGQLPRRYNYLNTNKNVNVIEIESNKNWKNADALAEKYGKYDLAIALDCPDTKLMASDYNVGIFKRAKYNMKIDHHPYREEFNAKYNKNVDNNYAKINLVDDTLPAASELVMQFVEPMGLKSYDLKKETKDAIYTGMLTDSGCFKYVTSALPFKDAAALISEGVDNKDLIMKSMGNTPHCVLKVQDLARNSVQYSDDKRIAYIVENDEIIAAKNKARDEGYFQEAKDVIKFAADGLRNIEGVEIAFKLSQMKGRSSISVRSRDFDVSEIAKSHGGGGHKNASAFTISNKDRSYQEVAESVVKEYQDALNKHEKTEVVTMPELEKSDK